ncbi:MAG: hypothetical protein AB1665_03970 [Candidatus Thermoplasmatota archaeon]
MLYDIERAFKESGLSRREMERLKKKIKKEFPNDEMMYELHVVRALHALKRGATKKST